MRPAYGAKRDITEHDGDHGPKRAKSGEIPAHQELQKVDGASSQQQHQQLRERAKGLLATALRSDASNQALLVAAEVGLIHHRSRIPPLLVYGTS